MKETITLAEWLAALRSGKYRQGRGYLLDQDGGHCCLGVGVAETRGFSGDRFPLGGNSMSLPYFHFLSDLPGEMWGGGGNIYLGDAYTPRWVSDLNDVGYTFSQIADEVEARARELGWTPEAA